MPPRIDSPHLMLVEGSDDLHSVIHLMERHGFDWDNEKIVRPYVSSAGGLGKLLEEFPIALKGPYKRIGVLVDANSHMGDRWAQLRSRAEAVGVKLPEVPEREGTITAGSRPDSRVGIWLMPDNTSPGTLESFLGKLVPNEDLVWSYAGEVVVEARRRGAHCRQIDDLKSRLHTWLAWQEDPGLPFGTALRAQVFLHDTPDALSFVDWFRRLFIDP